MLPCVPAHLGLSISMTTRYLIIADDLSGAADCAAGFAGAGLSADVLLDVHDEACAASTQVLTVDSDSRRDAAALSRAKLEIVLARHGQKRTVIKKIDSTLRGGWAHEVAMLQRVLGVALVAPAFPAMGRVVRDGVMLVHGRRLGETDLWKLEHAGQHDQPAQMLGEAGLAVENAPLSVLAEGVDAALAFIARAAAMGAQAIVFDADGQAHLDTLAQASLRAPSTFCVCSAGLSYALAKAAAGNAQPMPSHYAMPQPEGKAKGVVTIVGSMSDVARQQVRYLAEQAGTRLYRIAPESLRMPRTMHDAPTPTDLPRQLQDDMAQGLDVVVTLGLDAHTNPAEGPRLAARLALLLRQPLVQAAGLVVTGGETARAVLHALGIRRLHIHTQSEPGVVISVSDADTPQWIATKAGAFGSPASLHRASLAIRLLQSHQAPPSI